MESGKIRTLYFRIIAGYVLAPSPTDSPVYTPDEFRPTLRLRPLSLRAVHKLFTSSTTVISIRKHSYHFSNAFW